MGETGGGDDVADMVKQPDPRLVGIFVAQRRRDDVGHRFADTGHFDRMGQSVVDEDAARQRKDLCLVLQAAKGRREDQTVVVAAEVGAGRAFLRVVIVFEPEALIVDEFLPFHVPYCCFQG